jgi:hypothetical protein
MNDVSCVLSNIFHRCPHGIVEVFSFLHRHRFSGQYRKIRLSDGLGFLFALSLVTEAFLVDEFDGTVNCSPVGGLQ